MPDILYAREQIERVNRKGWHSANELAQELYVILGTLFGSQDIAGNVSRGGFLPEDIVGITPPAGSLPTAFPIAAFAVVTGFVTYNTYDCDIYLVNPTVAGALPITNMVVTQFMVDSLEVIPNGSGIPCLLHVETRAGGTKLEIVSASMQFPVYLEIP